jgi:hypothetical protein
MFCPKCGTDNMSGSKFCRACGMDINTVQMLMSGQVAVNVESRNEEVETSRRSRRRKKKKELTYADAFEDAFVGLAFLIIFAVGLLFFAKFVWVWIWFIIPALACMGSGIGQLFQLQQQQAKNPSQLDWTEKPAFFSSQPARVNELPPRQTSEMIAPPSVTENTTRHLGGEMPAKIFEERN